MFQVKRGAYFKPFQMCLVTDQLGFLLPVKLCSSHLSTSGQKFEVLINPALPSFSSSRRLWSYQKDTLRFSVDFYIDMC